MPAGMPIRFGKSKPRLRNRRLLHRKRKQHVAGRASLAEGVAGSGEQHSSGDGWAGAAHGAAFSRCSVDRGELLDHVKLPEKFAVACRKSTQDSVVAASKDHARNYAER